MSPQSEQKSVSLRGCLSSSDDRFVLTTQDGKTVKVEGDAAIAIEFDRVPYMLLQFERYTFLKVDSVTHVSANCTSIQGWS
jgi:hypothetical protein